MYYECTYNVLLPYRFTLFSNGMTGKSIQDLVLLPYRFTLFSNQSGNVSSSVNVLLPYRFTLFSNKVASLGSPLKVLLPYRFTLFSNEVECSNVLNRFYYLIDLHYSQTYHNYERKTARFTTL